MSRWTFVLLTAMMILAQVTAAADRPSEVKLPGWGNAINPDHDCRIDVADNGAGIHITVPPSAHDFAAELQRWNAPRVIRKVRGDFIAEVRVGGRFDPQESSTIDGRKPYNGAGLIAIDDPQNAVSLQRGAFIEGGKIRHYLNFEVRQEGKVTVSSFGMDIKNAPCWLRLERRGAKFFAMVSEDGVNWKSYPLAEAGFPGKLKVGVEAVNSSTSEFQCGFEQIGVFQKKITQNAASE